MVNNSTYTKELLKMLEIKNGQINQQSQRQYLNLMLLLLGIAGKIHGKIKKYKYFFVYNID